MKPEVQPWSEIDAELVKVIKSGKNAALVSAASIRACAPYEKQVKMLVGEDGSITGSIGGGDLQTRVISEAINVIKAGKSKRIRIGVSAEEEIKRGMEPGGTLKYFIEPVRLLPQIYIFGAGELAFYIARFAALLRYRITVIDISADYATPARFPGAQVIVEEDFARAFRKVNIDPAGYIVIATRNHEYQELVLELSLETGVRYVGMAACSEKKKQRYLANMADRGFPDERLKSVYAPIGLEVHAQTMEEIALSIIAELVGIIRSKGIKG